MPANEPNLAELFCIGCAIKEASAKLQAMIGGKFFSIQMQLVFPEPGQVESNWQVFDGITHSMHTAKTLAGAVNQTMIAIVDHAADAHPCKSASPSPPAADAGTVG